ncbi:MAG: exonuclease SbcCD subunit D [Ruminococcus sp.]|uniref:exonuclease SbcCD subunit D n=1 Tax=Ruminococcus sp. TaxID=41978 RepID=UPI0025D2B67C|nr:exonuclease SbcCD subunit D [Ruminococcus sp.]MCR4794510.1 exonuclease SbcCD subunit D [Ruminococcus sp.]
MKFIHLSDLHLGKRLNEFSMIEDQDFILKEIYSIISEEEPDFVIIAGDIYDKSVPSAEAVHLFDAFLTKVSERTGHIFVISGNHDSAERIAFGSHIMEKSGIHMSPVFDGEIVPTVLHDEYGDFGIYMLPFIKPVTMRRYFTDTVIESYTDAVNAAVDAMNVDFTRRNIIIAHQFVTGAVKSDSEEVSVGGLDNVESSAFDGFDYVALGHIHSPQNVGSERIRYCGTPLKYSFSEANQEKSVTIVEMGEKGKMNVRTAALSPRRDLRVIRGAFDEVISREVSAEGDVNDYIHIVLTDEEDIPEAMGKLRTVYPHIMSLEYDNSRTRSEHGSMEAARTEDKLPIELFEEFYEFSNGREMSPQQRELMQSLIEKIWEGEE